MDEDDGINDLGAASEVTHGSVSGPWCEQSIIPWRLTKPIGNPPPIC